MTAFDDPAEDTLATVLRIHCEVLERDGIGAEDNFYDHGGNSLLALRVIRRIAEETKIRVPARAVFTAATLGELAREVDVAAARDERSAPDATGPDPRYGRASMAQEWALLSGLEDPDAPALQFHAVHRLRGPVDAGVLRRAWQAVVDHHPALHTVFRITGGTAVQEVAATALADLRVEDLGALPEAVRLGEALDRLDTEVRRPFDRAGGPVVRAVLLRLGAEDHLLALVLDHIAADGWSLDIITRDLTDSYASLLAGRPARLPAAGSYPRWSADQWQRYENGRADEVAAYWKSQLGPDPSAFALRLPGYTGGGGLTGPAGLSRAVPGATADTLRAACADLRTTPYCVTLAALTALIAHRTGRARVTVLSTCGNRLDPGHHNTVGWFANGVFPTSDVDPGTPFRAFTARVRDTALAATAHGDLPAWYVRRRMWPTVPAGFRKDPGVYFMYNDLWGEGLRLGEATAEPVFLDEHADSPGLHLWIQRVGDTLRLHALHYRSEYSPADAGRFADDFLTAVGALCRNLDRPMRDVLAALDH